MTDISRAFTTGAKTLGDLVRSPGVGYYIPVYQRPYSWDRDNVEHLMDDLLRSAEDMLRSPADDNAEANLIWFLGTLILVAERPPRYPGVDPKDVRALPTKIYNVIDGQQRLSTIALMAALLLKRITDVFARIPHGEVRTELTQPVEKYRSLLLEMVSVDIGDGAPTRKPIIIRGHTDMWTYNGADSAHYFSDVASHLAATIRAADNQGPYPNPKEAKGLVKSNLETMDEHLLTIEEAHRKDSGYPPAWEILEPEGAQERLWSYERPVLLQPVLDREADGKPQVNDLCALIQLLAFCRFLSDGCCFTVIEPTSEEWAFDMFQSLNATGTPLTALETFRPLVVQAVGEGFRDSPAAEYFASVDALLGLGKNAAAKSRQTNELLTAFAIAREGEKLPAQFSKQRRWLYESFHGLQGDPAAHEEFVRELGDLARYWTDVALFEPASDTVLPGTRGVADDEAAALCVLYLKAVDHAMAHTVLSRFYSRVIRGAPGAAEDFVAACKAVAAFYTLWRSARGNSGLDDVYRKMFAQAFGWAANDAALTLANLQERFRSVLTAKQIGTMVEWQRFATQNLRYDNVRVICRFALFVAAHDTHPDPHAPGLMQRAKPGYSEYLTGRNWSDADLKSLEHVAPVGPPDGHAWDQAIYDDNLVDRVGNLVLLRSELNTAAANRDWAVKWLYFEHLQLADPAKEAQLQTLAKSRGTMLSPDVIKMLQTSKYARHMEPVASLGIAGTWDAELIKRRTDRIAELLWERMWEWLN
ncbi:MAG: hypothetical protein JWM27_4840 [Gemmatimonadetes bacterium]|nr:hypothetical protein [Gemmatimonadota bacterium]